jgi:hypothetical protein
MPDTDDILWFKQQFQGKIKPLIENDPFSVDMITAVACQETGEVWPLLRKHPLSISELLELCVGDTLDAGRGRTAFPSTKEALVSEPKGNEMFDVARKALVDMAKYVPSYKGAAANPDKFCHAFGIFQYDLQFFKTEPDYFLDKLYADFDECLKKCLGELREAMKRIGWQNKTALTDYEMACVGIAYNTGKFRPERGLKQGYFDGRDYYGQLLFHYLNLSKSVTTLLQKCSDKPGTERRESMSPVNPVNSIVAGIYDELGAIFSNFLVDLSPVLNTPEGSKSLLDQLQKGKSDTPDITFGLTIDFVGGSILSLLQQVVESPFEELAGFLQNLFDPAETPLRFFKELSKELRDIVSATSVTLRGNAIESLFSGHVSPSEQQQQLQASLQQSMSRLRQLACNEIGTAMSLATIMKALEGKETIPGGLGKVPEAVEKALLAYFFKKEGYQTIDGSSIVAPVHLSDLVNLPADAPDDVSKLKQLRSYFSKSTAETCIRDVIRVTVESSYDTARGLEGYYKTVDDDMKGVSQEVEKRFVTWFKGFSGLADSAAMRAVELATQGVSTFQTNALIAAAAGTFAGTFARKLAQDAFLGVIIRDKAKLPDHPLA